MRRTPRAPRSNNASPTVRSSEAIALLIAGWRTRRARVAALKLPAFATATKVRSWFKSSCDSRSGAMVRGLALLFLMGILRIRVRARPQIEALPYEGAMKTNLAAVFAVVLLCVGCGPQDALIDDPGSDDASVAQALVAGLRGRAQALDVAQWNVMCGWATPTSGRRTRRTNWLACQR